MKSKYLEGGNISVGKKNLCKDGLNTISIRPGLHMIPLVVEGRWDFYSRPDVDEFIKEIEEAGDEMFGEED